MKSNLKQGLSIPSLFLSSEQWSEGPNNDALNLLMKNSQNTTLILMNKTNHVDFSMSYMVSPLTNYIGFTGKLGGRPSSYIQKELIVSFFDKNLRNNTDGNKDYLKEIVNKHENLTIADVERQ